LCDRGGVVGIIFFPWYLSTNPVAGIDCIADHVCYVAEKFGAKHVALGSDWDGFVWMPRGLPDVASLPRLTAELLRRGVSEDDVRGILGENFLRVWREARAAAGQKPESARQSPK
jgi:membrane dipeptidase